PPPPSPPHPRLVSRSTHARVRVRFRAEQGINGCKVQLPIHPGRRPVHLGESPSCPCETLDAAGMEHLRRLAQFLLASARGDGAGRRRPSPRTRPRTTAPWTAGRTTARSPPPLRRPEAADPPPLRGHVSAAARARPSTTTRWEEPCDDMLPRPQPLRPQESRMDQKGQSLNICINYRGSQVHMEYTMIKCILVL
uniref:Uncharacterized protein n=1 Tax=Aegilops tauschii subsp. strangulata TaxID=200361 RepID=A0A453D6J2_AEGTS